MKQLCCLATITFLSAQAYAGTILPNLSRTKSEANESPIAVGFSNRNSANFSFSRNEGTVDGNSGYDQTLETGAASLFLTTSRLHMEFATSYSDNEVKHNSPASASLSDDNYNIAASFATSFADVFTGGVSVSSAFFSDLTGATSKVDNNIITITPAIGMKIQPNMAVGLGLRHAMNKVESSTVGVSTTELPNLNTNEIFAGVAYGVDQKIGENGFGAEAVVGHSFKTKEQTGTLAVSQGAVTSLTVDGNYTLDELDLGAKALFATGKDYNDTRTRSAQLYSVRPEYMVSGFYYVAPEVTYAHAKNFSVEGTDNTSDTKGWLYGLGLGRRSHHHDIELSYNHGSQDITPGTLSLSANVYAARVSFYF